MIYENEDDLNPISAECACDCMACQVKELDFEDRDFLNKVWNAVAVIGPWVGIVFAFAVCVLLMLCGPCTPAHAYSPSTKDISVEYTDKQIVNAIRKAEGVWTYGYCL
jgi:hypothetical protein